MPDLKKVFLLTFCFLTVFAHGAWAKAYQDSYISINATDITYNKLRKVYEATGSVAVRGDDFKIYSAYIRYYPATKMIVADDQFTMEIAAYRIAGSRLEYNAATKDGNVMIARINFGDTYLGGSYMKMEKGRYNILNAYFTGCNYPSSDYHGSSNEIVFYPETGLLVGYWGTFFIGSIPTLPLPTLVYGAPVPEKPETKGPGGPKGPAKKYIDRTRDVWPKSGVGFNDDDGYFLAVPVDGYLGPKNYVRTHLIWAEKKNLGLATAANYMLFNDRYEGEIRAGSTGGDGTFGGLTQIMAVGPSLLSKEEDDQYIYDSYFIGNKYMYEGEVNLSYKERIHLYKNEGPFNRVSFLPKVSLRANRNNFINDNFTYFSEVNWAMVSEESSGVSGQRQEFLSDVTFDYDLWLLGKFKAKSQADIIGYTDLTGTDETGYWSSATQDLSLTQKWWDLLETGIGHDHIYFNYGATPFDFEEYWYSPYDTMSTHVKLNLWFSSVAFDGKFDLPSQDWRKLTYSISLGMHCYNIVSSYSLRRDMNGEESAEFLLTAELTPSKW